MDVIIEVNYNDLLVNNTSEAVSESLIGLCSMNPNLEILDIGNVVLLKGLKDCGKVFVVSGGASGMEPAYAQFVGSGMLAAAIQGDILASPPCKPILKTLRELTYMSLKGILLIVPGNSGELLSFGLAFERSKKEKMPVMMLSVLDHYDNPMLPEIKRRGLSGIVLVIKVAGAMAEEGVNLKAIHEYCDTVTKNLISTSFITSTTLEECRCRKKGPRETNFSLHGEKSIIKVKKCQVKDICSHLIDQLMFPDKRPDLVWEDHTTPFVLLVNNVGGLSKMEELIVIKELIMKFEERGFILCRVYSGSYITSKLFNGFTISLLRVFNDNILKYLDAPTTALAWKNIQEYRDNVKIIQKTPSILRKQNKTALIPIIGPKLTDISSQKLITAASFACQALISCEKQLNTMDLESGNGNTGSRLKMAAGLFLKKISSNSLSHNLPYHFFQYLSKICEYQIGGSMGVLLCIILEAFSNTFAPLEELDSSLEAPMWLEALKNAANALKKYTLAKSGDNTILDPIEECIRKTVDNLFISPTYLDAFGCGVEAAERITKELKKKGNIYPDPGAHAMVIIFRSCYEAIKSM